MRLVIWALLGAVVGFVVMYMTLSFQMDFDFYTIAFQVNVILTALTIVLLLYIGLSILQMRKKSDANVSDDEEDERDIWLYKKFSDTNMLVMATIIIGIVATSISLITGQPTWLELISTVTVIIAFILSISVSSLVNKFYPDRNLPSVSEKDYAKKLLAASDEGERHVMLEGLYRSFNLLNGTLILALFLLAVYSIGTGVSQLFSIFVIAIILLGANAKYFLLIRKKS
ncbi:DUF3169 family protein [Sporosarcina sp. ZBG7A]|uniref:DUF3169 family protein n=1 Tax=Sporosarcina sp. ZBG7A TaxID=1582223 RepID=UPI00057A06E6|nr:DUF3169 family protein [Sporosarcina sp. ZBG7A]VDG97781.1 Protein of uncharacterised function (DUF3169) [Lysinibacillus sphaericus]